MRTVLAVTVVLFLLGMALNLYRMLKLRRLQEKRNRCDLTTFRGREMAKYYNKEINKLMNFDDTTGGHN